MGRGAVRALVIASAVMGVLIVLGVAGLVAVATRRFMAPPSRPATAAILDEPAGTRIAGASGGAEALVLRLEGGGPDRVLLVDPRTGRRIATVALAR